MISAGTCWVGGRPGGTQEQEACFPQGLTLEPPEMLLDPAANKELLGLWMAAKLLFGRTSTLTEKVKTNQLGGPNCVLFVPMFGFLATHGEWPTAWLYDQAEAIENWPVDEMPAWGTALRDH